MSDTNPSGDKQPDEHHDETIMKRRRHNVHRAMTDEVAEHSAIHLRQDRDVVGDDDRLLQDMQRAEDVEHDKHEQTEDVQHCGTRNSIRMEAAN